MAQASAWRAKGGRGINGMGCFTKGVVAGCGVGESFRVTNNTRGGYVMGQVGNCEGGGREEEPCNHPLRRNVTEKMN